jgi:hypothetical protein
MEIYRMRFSIVRPETLLFQGFIETYEVLFAKEGLGNAAHWS